MNSFNHFLVTFLLVKYFGVIDPLSLVFSFAFGVLIDLDEIYTIYKFYSKSKKLSELKNFFKRGLKRRTQLQESGGLLISLIISAIIGSIVPFICNVSHCIMNWMSYYESTPLAPFYNGLKTRGFIKTFGLGELMITSALLFVLFLKI